MKKKFLYTILIFNFFVNAQTDTLKSKKWEIDYGTELEFENQFFPKKGIYNDQRQYFFSGAIKSNLNIESLDKKHTLKADLFYRLSASDENRTHYDIRELYYKYKDESWSLSIGYKKIFWGVMEVNNLVNIINQSDLLEGSDGNEKLGQPMIQFTLSKEFGNLEAYYLPMARKISFVSKNGRFRFPIVLETDDIPFKYDAKEWYPSFAIRWSKSISDFDIGTSVFHGVTREPMFLGFSFENGFNLSYPVINQYGLDVQYSQNNWLFKLESIHRTTELQNFVAITTGFEYTFANIKNSGIDAGIVSEYLYDSRKLLTFSGFDNDIFIGSRIVLNDTQNTEILIGGIFDLEKTSKSISLEGSKRLGSSYKINLKANFFANISEKEVIYNFKEDDFIQLRLSKFF